MNNKEQTEARVMTQHTRSHEENAEFLTMRSNVMHRSEHTEKRSPFKIGVINSPGSIHQCFYHFGNYTSPSTHVQRRELKILTLGLEKKKQSKQALLAHVPPAGVPTSLGSIQEEKHFSSMQTNQLVLLRVSAQINYFTCFGCIHMHVLCILEVRWLSETLVQTKELNQACWQFSSETMNISIWNMLMKRVQIKQSQNLPALTYKQHSSKDSLPTDESLEK